MLKKFCFVVVSFLILSFVLLGFSEPVQAATAATWVGQNPASPVHGQDLLVYAQIDTAAETEIGVLLYSIDGLANQVDGTPYDGSLAGVNWQFRIPAQDNLQGRPVSYSIGYRKVGESIYNKLSEDLSYTPIVAAATVDSSLEEGAPGWGYTAFSDLSEAIAKVDPGAIIKVNLGNGNPYTELSPILIDKPLQILGQGSYPETPLIRGKFVLASQWETAGRIYITNLRFTDAADAITIGDAKDAKFDQVELSYLNIGTAALADTTAIKTAESVSIKALKISNSTIYAAHGINLNGDIGAAEIYLNNFNLTGANAGKYDAITISQDTPADSSVDKLGKLQVYQNTLTLPANENYPMDTAILNQATGALAGAPGGKTLTYSQNKAVKGSATISDEGLFVKDRIAEFVPTAGPVKIVRTGATFSTIQAAVDAAQAGDTIEVSAGNYQEQLNITKSLILNGPNAGVHAKTGDRLGEAVISFPAEPVLDAENANLVTISAYNVSFAGFTLEGKDLPKTQLTQGVYSTANNVTVKNNIIRNFTKIGYISSAAYNKETYFGVLVEGNYLYKDEAQTGYDFDYSGIYLQGTQGIVRGNYIQNTYRGIQIQPYLNTTLTQGLVENNTILPYRTGLYFNYSYAEQSNWLFRNNSITGIPFPYQPAAADDFWEGILVQTYSKGQVSFTGNSIDPGSASSSDLYNYRELNRTGGTVNADLATANSFSTMVRIERAGVLQPDIYIRIQDAIDAAQAGDTIHAGPGVYAEALTINKQVSLLGPNATVDPISGTRLDEAIIMPPALNFEEGDLINLAASGVTIKGFTLDGDNPALTGNPYDYARALNTSTVVGGLSFQNNIVTRFNRYGLLLDNNMEIGPSTDNLISHNLFSNINGTGVYIMYNAYADISENRFDGVGTGVGTENFWVKNPGAPARISQNSISSTRRGILYNNYWGEPSSFTVNDNTINAVDTGTAGAWTGIEVWSQLVDDTVVITDNVIVAVEPITRTTTGYRVWNILASKGLNISGGSVTGTDYGFWSLNKISWDGTSYYHAALKVALNELSLLNQGTAGVYVNDNSDDAADPINQVTLNSLKNSGGVLDLWVDGPQAQAIVTGSDLEAAASAKFVNGGSGSFAQSNLAGSVINEGTPVVMANNNYWGQATGPRADQVSGNVSYCYWLTAAAPSTEIAGRGLVRIEGSSTPYCSIQAAVNAASAGDTVLVGAGTYAENVIIDKTLNLVGEGQDKVTVYPALSDPKVCSNASICDGSSNIFLVRADNVKISGFTLDGDNPALTSGVLVGGADLNARIGIVTDHLTGNFTGLEVFDTTVKNIYLRGIYASSGAYHFQKNTVSNVQGEAGSIAIFGWSGPGKIEANTVSYASDAISANWSYKTEILGNTISHAGSGIHLDNAGDAAGSLQLVEGNTITACTEGGYGIWLFSTYQPVTVRGNTVSGCAVAYAAFGNRVSQPSIFENNVGTGMTNAEGVKQGYGFVGSTNLGTPWGYLDQNLILRGNTLNGFAVGVKAEAESDSANSPYTAKTITLEASGNDLSGNDQSILRGDEGNYLVTTPANWYGTNLGSEILTKIDSRLDFTPWLSTGTDTDVEAVGFQADLSALHVGSVGEQTGTVNRVQEGIDLVNPGGTVSVEPGRYTGAVTIKKALTLASTGGAEATTLYAGDLPTDGIYMVDIQSSDVTLNGFTITSPNYDQPAADLTGVMVGSYGQRNLTNIVVTNNQITQIGASTRLVGIDDYPSVGITVNGVIDGLQITNNKIYEIHQTVSDPAVSWGPTGIGYYGHEDPPYSTKVLISGNEISNISAINTGTAKAIANGIRLGYGSGEGIVSDNQVTAIGGRALAITSANNGLVTVTGNLLAQSDTGLYMANSLGGTVEENNIIENKLGVELAASGIAEPAQVAPSLHFNRIYKNANAGLSNAIAGPVDAQNNWWGCNSGPLADGTPCDRLSSSAGTVDHEPWLVLSSSLTPSVLDPGDSAVFVASLLSNSASETPSTEKMLPDGIPASFSASSGTLAAETGQIEGGKVENSFTAAKTEGFPEVCLTVDAEKSCPAAEVIVGEMVAEEFTYTFNDKLLGYSTGFNILYNDLTGAESLVVTLYAGDKVLQVNTAVIAKFEGIHQITAPFDVFGSFDYTVDGYWVNTRSSEFGQTLTPTKVVAVATLANGKVVTAENTLLTGDPALIENSLLTETETALAYQYPDYTWLGESSFDKAKASLHSKYTAAEFLADAVMKDLARYLGALYRQDASTIRTITYAGVDYHWNENLSMAGSRWADADGKTLVSALVAAFKADPSLRSFTLTVKDTYHQLDLHLSFEILNTLDAEIASAPAYVYDDAYAYVGAFAFEDTSNVYTVTYDDTQFDPNAMNDLARYLGALYRQAGASVAKISYAGVDYTWNEALTMKGSRWADAAGKTLVSAIVADFQAGKVDPATGIVLTLSDGLHTETVGFKFVIRDTIAPTVLSMKAFGAAGYGDVQAQSMTFTVDQGYKVARIEIQVSEDVEVAEGTLVSLGGASYGTLTGSGTLLTVTPLAGNEIADQIGSFAFSIPAGSVKDLGGNALASLTATLVVNNIVPVASVDAYTMQEDQVLTVAAEQGLLLNDTDYAALKAILRTEPSNGTLALAEDGSFTYTPNADFFGTESFTYAAFDGLAYSADTAVRITVDPVNDAPIAVDASFEVLEGVVLKGQVTATDVDDALNTLSFSLEALPEFGIVTMLPNGQFQYQASAGVRQPDSFSFRVTDPDGLSSVGTVKLTISGPNRPPALAVILPQTVNEGELLSVQLVASDPDGDTLSFSMLNAPAGAAIDPKTMLFTWTPDESQGGKTLTVKVCVSDGSSSGQVCQDMAITVLETNQSPVVGVIPELKPEVEQPFTYHIPASDPDIPAQALQFSFVGSVPQGMSVNATTGLITWTPGLDYADTPVTVTVQVCDADKVCVSRSVLMVVSGGPAPFPSGLKLFLPIISR